MKNGGLLWPPFSRAGQQLRLSPSPSPAFVVKTEIVETAIPSSVPMPMSPIVETEVIVRTKKIAVPEIVSASAAPTAVASTAITAFCKLLVLFFRVEACILMLYRPKRLSAEPG